MKKIFVLWILILSVLFLLPNAYAQPARSIVDSDYDALDVNTDGSIDISQDGFSITPQTKTNDNYGEVRVNSTETDTVVWTPTSGNKIVLMGIAFWADALDGFYVETGSTKVIPNSGISVASGVTVIDGGYPIWKGAVDATLTYTTTVDSIHSILMWGYEE